MALIQASIFHSQTGTNHFKRAFNKFKDPIQESSQDLPIVLLYITSNTWPAQLSCFHLESMYLTSILWAFESIQLWCPPYRLIGVCLGRVHLSTIRMVGWALCSSLIPSWYQVFCVPMFHSAGLVPLCLWNHSALFSTQGFAIPMSYIFVLRDTDQTIPLHELQGIAVNHCYSALCQVPASCQGPQFYYFSHSPWTRPLPQQATPLCLAGGMANSPI
jgi:hypothetical protein